MSAACDVMFGSHLCDLPLGHGHGVNVHVCGDEADEDGPCARLTIDEDGVGWIEHWSYPVGKSWAEASWSEPYEFPWARLQPLDPAGW